MNATAEKTRNGTPNSAMTKSQVKHPLLIEAVLRLQFNARIEMLPIDRPVDIREAAR